MPPSGPLTPAQFEVLEAVWAAGPEGASATEIWRSIAARRDISRTTILTLVNRLKKRGWLRRHDRPAADCYTAAMSRVEAHTLLAQGFVEDFFGGSMSNLVHSLLGARGVSTKELERLRKLLNARRSESTGEGRS